MFMQIEQKNRVKIKYIKISKTLIFKAKEGYLV
jgi:hypothetical protein